MCNLQKQVEKMLNGLNGKSAVCSPNEPKEGISMHRLLLWLQMKEKTVVHGS